MIAKLTAAFGEWRPAAAPLPEVPRPAPQSGRRVLLIDKPGATQTYFWLGNGTELRNGPARVLESWDESLPGYGYVLGMFAFGLEECGQYQQAERAGRRRHDDSRRRCRRGSRFGASR